VRPAPQLTFETPERVALTLEVAGLGGRALAYLADLLVLFLAWVTALLLYSVGGDLLSRAQQLSAAAQVAAVVLFFLTGWGYDVLWETLWRGQTPGKRLLGVRVVRKDGSPVGFVESVVRNAARALEVPFLYAPGVLSVALTPWHQRLGDLLAGTLVVKDRAYDLSRYGTPPAADASRWEGLRGRAAALLAPAEFERLADFLRRREALVPAARTRLAGKIAGALAARAGAGPLAPEEAEPFLESLAAAYASEGPP
jgi:uncharacterized RDD family membrane protein YckC